MTSVGSFLTFLLVLLVVLSGVLFPSGGTEVNLIARLNEPFQSSAFPLGTDPLGRDILLESSLTFLGLGADPQTPSWGGMLSEGRSYIQPLGGSLSSPESRLC